MIRATLTYLAHRLRGHSVWTSRWVGWCADCGTAWQRRNPITDPTWRKRA